MADPTSPASPTTPTAPRRAEALGGPVKVGAMRRLRAGRPIDTDDDLDGRPRSVDQFVGALSRSIEASDQAGEGIVLLRITHRAIPHPESATSTTRLQLHPRLHERLTSVRPSMVAVAVSETETLAYADGLDRRGEAQTIIEEASAALSRPIDVDGLPHFLAHRLGAAVHDGENPTPDRLLDATHLALRETDPSRQAMLFHPHQRAVEERAAELRTDLRLAIQQGEIDVALQPAIDLGDGSITSVEAFVRWNRHGGGPVASTDILQAARSLDLTHQLNRKLIERSFHVASALTSRGLLGAVTMWINVTPDEVLHPDFVDTAAAAVEVDPLLTLGLKVRPSPTNEDFAVKKALKALHGLGAKIAIGDFGVGFSDFAGVSSFPFDTAMLERALIRKSTSSTQAAGVLKLLVAAARRLELDVIAQGVETEQQLRLLHYTGCTKVQGYLVQKPLPPEELIGYLGDWAPLPIIDTL